MHPLTLRTIRQAQARGASLDMELHYDAVATLERAACETDGSAGWESTDLLDRPVIVGEVEPRWHLSGVPAVLYTPSYAALVWMEDAGDWFAGDRKLSLLAGAWALASARDPDAFREASRPDIARQEIKRWGRSINCGLRELAEAYNAIMQAGSAAAQTSGEASADDSHGARDGKLRRVLLRLQAEFGHDDDYWLYGPAAALRDALRLLAEQDAAEERAIAKAQGKTVAQDPDSHAVKAFARWRAARVAFFAAVGIEEATS